MNEIAYALRLHLDVLVARNIVVRGAQGSQENELRNDDTGHNEHDCKADSNDLDTEHDNTAPGRLGKAGPGVTDSGIAETTNNNGLDAAVERAVERNDGIGVNRQKRGLDADENDVGRDLNGDLKNDSDEQDASNTAKTLDLRNIGILLAAKKEHDADATQANDLRGSPENECRPPGGAEGGLEGRKAAPEALARGGRNDDVDPGSVELNADEGANQVGQDKRIGDHGVNDAVDKSRHKALGDKARQAAEESSEATGRSE